MGAHEYLHELSNALLSTPKKSTEKSVYISLEDGTTLRLADHYASVANFKVRNNTKDNYGIVIKLSNQRFKEFAGVDYIEYVYYPDKLDADKQKDILKGIKDFIKTKDFKSLPSPDRINQSDAYRHRTASEEARQRAIAAQAQTLSTAEIEEYVNEVAKSLPEGVKVVVTNSVESGDREHTGWYDK